VDTIRAATHHGPSYLCDVLSLDRGTIEANNAGNPTHNSTLAHRVHAQVEY
jgi:hypothetical protein